MQQRMGAAGGMANVGKAWGLLSNGRYKISAVIVWAFAVVTTYQFLVPILARQGYGDQATWWAAAVIQLILTVIESEFWHGQRGQVSGAAVVVDTLVNAAGLFPFVGGLSATNVWTMISAATGAGASINVVSVVIISLFLGYILAATPERIWR